MFPQPRGRPRKNCYWNSKKGVWRQNTHSSVTAWSFNSSVNLGTSSEVFNAPSERNGASKQLDTTLPVDATPPAPPAPPPAPPPPPPPQPDPRKEHATWVANSLHKACPVYYLDAEGNCQELGKERKRKAIPTPTWPPAPRRKVVVQIKVFGPDTDRQLEEGEWELVDVEKWV
mgnify:CR=1 FL=1|jgi:hypothetical protein